MTDNDSSRSICATRANTTGARCEARAYQRAYRHKMNFLEDKAFWYMSATQTIPRPACRWTPKGKNTGALVKADIVLSARDTLGWAAKSSVTS